MDTSATSIDNILITNPSNFTSSILLYAIFDRLPIYYWIEYYQLNTTNEDRLPICRPTFVQHLFVQRLVVQRLFIESFRPIQS